MAGANLPTRLSPLCPCLSALAALGVAQEQTAQPRRAGTNEASKTTNPLRSLRQVQRHQQGLSTPRDFLEEQAEQVKTLGSATHDLPAYSICTRQQSQDGMTTITVASTKGLTPSNLSSRTAELARKPDGLVAHFEHHRFKLFFSLHP
ncbi:MAG: hypothetical protein J3Q66DRAFT_373960 [Benniella sp.]|nr:MAG: hypothetical protein J3Q66DRAFT_373960 [Benniella sp.]